ncbi:hypothetical protein M405DRAFT_868590 [Rhizopogon salebrosus TDB-379]|nr:hypothetical protein M405DRAFT_868590 [Rhizopogon salebrosus TDB-379]
MSSALIQYMIPDLLSLYLFEFPKANTYFQECSAERKVWVSGFDIVNEKQSTISEMAQSVLLCALIYPYSGRDELRMTCDFLNLLFLLDHLSGDMDGKDAHGAKITPDFRQSLLRCAKLQFLKRFLSSLKGYTQAVAQEAGLRE